ncbi:MAG: SagB/ThcOx family dehydrogenase [Chloroflexota bacterium]|nr:SagB/ThcOx family dehydrogenase [Chloroflexota bacterium]MDE2683435.1 SagB/ThcOx family dehydrogenase [Chloroflexota bacterium]
MTTADNASVALRFNEATKLQYINLDNKPPLYKVYPGLRAIGLPDVSDQPGPQTPTLAAIRGDDAGDQTGPLTLEKLTSLLYHSAAVIRRRQLSDGEVHYRAAASAGALYPTEIYVVCGDLEGLRAGVYHFNPRDCTLARLRNGDLRRWVASAVGDHAAYPATLVFTTVFWRSAWKYRERGYRYCYWDLGTVSSNLLAAANAEAVPVKLNFGFVDRMLTGYFGIDGITEAPSLVASVGAPDGMLPDGPGDVPGALPQESNDLTAGAIDYPMSAQVHAAVFLQTHDDLSNWNEAAAGLSQSEKDELDGTGDTFRPLRSGNDGAFDGNVDLSALASTPLADCIRSRGSTRRFSREAIPWEAFRSVVDAAGSAINAPGLESGFSPNLGLYFIVNAVEGLEPGAYYYNPFYNGLRLLKAGDFREMAGHLGFEQALPADAAAVAFITADLQEIDRDLGPRGYRMVQTVAGIIGGRLYLGMHALGLGATGLTFYDDSVVEFFSPHAAGRSAVFVVPMGVPARPNRVRPFRSQIAVSLDSRARGAGQEG